MNRRSFFSKLGVAAAGFTILPAATTYARKWVPTIKTWESEWIVNPAWESSNYEMAWFKYYAAPSYIDHARTYFHQREAFLFSEEHLTKSLAGLISPPAMQVAPPPALRWNQHPTG